ncbi:MAG: hypothetical protein HXY34_13005 [Candidatus Thorarchaeota archaeon]|nr:hypothetical protein [Candidatus Thorarchaeota archaeon]
MFLLVRIVNRLCVVCFSLALTVIGLFALGLGIVGSLVSPQGFMGVLEPSGIPLVLPLGIGALATLFGLFLLVSTIRTGSMMDKVVAVAKAHKQITLDDISRHSGVKLPKVRPLLYRAVALGLIHGEVRENTFFRSEVAPKGEKVTIEREVMVTRKAPENCYKCGASINPQEVEWVGPDQVRCPHCGATMSVKTERI